MLSFNRYYRAGEMLLARWLPPCKSITELISRSQDHRLPLRQQLVIRLHLLTCQACARFEQQLPLLRTLMRHGGEHVEGDSSTTLDAEARARLKRRLALKDR